MGFLRFALSAIVLASGPVVAIGAGAQTAKSDDDRIICRRVDNTGTRMQRARICRAAREWRGAQAANDARRNEETDGEIAARESTATSGSLSLGGSPQ